MAQPLKEMVDESVVRDIADRVHRIDPRFDRAAFADDVLAELPALELKPRIDAIARRLRAGIADGYLEALDTVVAVARQEPPIEGFAAWPLCTFVEIFGLEHPDESLAAMEHLTQRASCEFAIRPYLREHWEKAYATLEGFATHRSADVRRLASEGTRPRLPWGSNVARLTADPGPGLALLERLRHDESATVRRSVANHLNDIAKTSPELVIATVQRWGYETETDPSMVRHALRTLVKRGDSDAMAALGYATEPAISVMGFSVAPHEVHMGDRITISAEIRSKSTESQLLVVDFVIHHVTKAGGSSPRVFKWKTIDLAAGGRVALSKRRLIQMASTRTYYSGKHRVELQIAGQSVAETTFDIIVP